MDRFARLPRIEFGMSLGMKPHTSHPQGRLSVRRGALLTASLVAATLLAACAQKSEAPVATAHASAPATGFGSTALGYPSAPRGDVVDDYFGTKVPDPYRAFEQL